MSLEITFSQGILVSKSASSGSGTSNFAISSAIGSRFSSTCGESSGAGEEPPPSAAWSDDRSDATLEIFRLFAAAEVEDAPESARFNAVNNRSYCLLKVIIFSKKKCF
jgi:hypothetical protein